MKIAFIIQRCGKEIVGGAESLCLNVAQQLSKYFEIEILTSCAIDYMSWENHYPSGIEKIGNVNIRRFKTDFTRDISSFNRLSDKVLAGSHSTEDELLWMKMQGPYCSGLFDFLTENKDNFDLFVFFTYLYATTYYGLPIIANKSILVPLAHDEPPLKLSIYDEIFKNSKAIIYHTEEEKNIILQRFGISETKGRLVGYGMDDLDTIPDNFSPTMILDFPYLLYVGRIDRSKGCDELIDFFKKYKKEHISKLKLVLVGPKIFKFVEDDDVIYLGVLNEEQKTYALKNMSIFVMPSKYESFSIATMEAWMSKKPVIVNSQSAVLKSHCEKSNGGLYYENYEEFVECINLLLSDVYLQEQMGKNGYKYVKENYSWDKIINEYRIFLNDVIKSS